MSDDDSESDIETMFQDAHNNIIRKTEDDDSDNSDNDDSDKKNTALGTPHQPYWSTKKRKQTVVDKKLEILSQRKAKLEQIDKVNSNKLQRIASDDDDDFLDEDDVKVVGASSARTMTTVTTRNGMTTRSTTTTTSTITTKPPNYVEPSITLLDSDDDDDDDNDAGVTTQRNLTSAATSTKLLYPPYSNTVQPQPISTVMNPFHAALIRGRVIPDMILPPSIHHQYNTTTNLPFMMNPQALPYQPQNPSLQPHLLSSIPLQQQYQQQRQRLKSTVANIMNTIDVDEIIASNQSNASQLLRIKVIATIIPNQGSSLPVPSLIGLPVVDLTSDEPTTVSQIKGSRTVSCIVDIIETSTIQVLMDRILQHYLKLNLKQNVIGLQYNNEPLYSKHTLDMYRIPVSGATIIATVHSSDNAIAPNSYGSKTAHGKSVNASSFATTKPKARVPKGNIMTLLLRRSCTMNGKTSSEEIPMTIGQLDPLQILVDQYRQHVVQQGSPNISKLTLQFDGDTILLERTPQQYDMENDDLIDVIVT